MILSSRPARSSFMTPFWSIVLPVPPRINEKFISRSYVVSKKHRDFKALVAKKMLMMGIRPYTCEVSVSVLWYRKRKAGDVDMFVKTLLDSMQGSNFGMYLNDSQVRELLVERTDEDRLNPRIEVRVEPYRDAKEKTEACERCHGKGVILVTTGLDRVTSSGCPECKGWGYARPE